MQTQSHCLVCTEWEEQRTGLSMDTLEGMVRAKEMIGSIDMELHNLTPVRAT